MDQDVVRKAPLFSALTAGEAEALIKQMTPCRLERGDTLFREGDSGDSLYVIAEGKIKLGRLANDTRENLVEILGRGEMFGELSMFDPGPRTMTATAVAETHLLALRNENLMTAISARPELARALLAALARRLRRTNDHLSDLVFTDVPGRVAKALGELADRFGRVVEDGVLIAHDLTQEELAQLVGASRETVNKALADFVARGLVRLESRAVLVLRPDDLYGRHF